MQQLALESGDVRQRAEPKARVLESLIGVVYQARTGLTICDRHVERVQHQLGRKVVEQSTPLALAVAGDADRPPAPTLREKRSSTKRPFQASSYSGLQ